MTRNALSITVRVLKNIIMSYKITIPQPCSEDWNKMTTTQKGAFCKSCAKEVIDFTATTKKELSRKIKQEDKLCGRFKPEQLNTPLPKVSQNQFRHNAVMLGFTSLLALGTPLVAQQTTSPTQKVNHYIVGRIAPQPVVMKKYTLTGVVKDSNDLPLPGVYLVLKGSSIGAQTDMTGKFSITIPTANTREKQVLWVSYIGFETQEIVIKESMKSLSISLVEDEVVFGDIVIEEYPVKKKDTLRKLKNLFRRKN